MSRRGGHVSATGGYSAPSRSEVAGFSGQGASAFTTYSGGSRRQEPCPHMKVATACRKCTPGGDRAAQGRRAKAAQESPEPAPEPRRKDDPS